MNTNKFVADLENFKIILQDFGKDRERLEKLINDINNNYLEFKDYNMDGLVKEETINDYEFGLTQSKNSLKLLNNEIESFTKILSDYIDLNESISESTGDKNGL